MSVDTPLGQTQGNTFFKELSISGLQNLHDYIL